MNLFKSKLRRTTAVLAGTFLGLAGVAAFAAPASAHKSTVTGETGCYTAEGWTVNWAVGNEYGQDAQVKQISVKDEAGNSLPLTGDLAANQAVVKAKSAGDDKSAEPTTGATEVTTAAEKVTITVTLEWADGWSNGGENSTLTSNNNAWRKPLTHTVEKGEACPEPSNPTTTPPGEEPEIPVPTPSEGADFGLPEPVFAEDCDTITIGLDNPADGVEWKLNYETSKGEKRELTVKPGEKKSETFSATEGFTVKLTLTLTYEGETESQTTTIAYEQPDDCDGGSGGGLPVTGAAAGGIAGGAAALLGLGAVLFFLARRRRVKFTA